MQSLKSLQLQAGLVSLQGGHFAATSSSVVTANGGEFVWQLIRLCATFNLCSIYFAFLVHILYTLYFNYSLPHIERCICAGYFGRRSDTTTRR